MKMGAKWISLMVPVLWMYATGAAASVPTKTLGVREVKTLEDFVSLAMPSQGVIRQGYVTKFFIDNRDASKPEIHFLNANYCPKSKCSSPPEEAILHYPFAKKMLKDFTVDKDTFTEQTYFTTDVASRKYFDGRIQQMRYTDTQGVEREIFAILFIERDLIHEEMVVHAMEVLQKAFIPKAPLVFVRNSVHQTVGTVEAQLEELGVGHVSMEELISNVRYIGLNPGTAFGFLRLAPSPMGEFADDLEPYEIPVFDELPLELAVVAGTITTTYQDVGSHVNLKSKERGTPNMVLRDAAEVARLRSLDGKPVKLTVTFQDFKVEEATEAQVMEAYRKATSGAWRKPSFENESKLVDFDAMCGKARAKDCLRMAKRYGGKVSGLGFLAHPTVTGVGSPLNQRLGYRLTPLGFGIPLSFYNDFIAHNVKRNPEFKLALDLLINSEMSLNGQGPLPTAEKKALIAKLKLLFLNGEIPPAQYKTMADQVKVLREQTRAAYGGVELEKIKVRSSANTEDIEGFNGAGLHDSYSAKLSKDLDTQALACRYERELDDDTGLLEDDVKPKNLGCAVKAVYASLWNLGAVRERSYRKFDHRFASMGVSVQPTYRFRPGIEIAANSVLITRVVGTEAIYGQQLSTQRFNGLVTNPVAGTKAELATVTFDASGKHVAVNVLQYAKPVAALPPLEQTVMSEELMKLHSEIARFVEVKYCEAKPDYAPGYRCSAVVNSVKKPAALDMEFKTFDNGEVLIKQVRSFYGK